MAVAIPLRSGARSRDEGALTAALYRQHAGELLRFAWHRLGRLEDAEDAVQATFLSAHRVLQNGEQVREPRAWLFRILRNECLTRIATTKRRGTHEELGEWHADTRASVADQMEANDEFDTAVALLATLPEQQREAMVLREWLGMSAIETAGVLDVTPQSVDALVYRARKALVGLDEVEAESACGEVRTALADAKVNARIRAHLLTCRSCRQAARQLRAPEELAAANGLLPFDIIATRLSESIPGFATAAAATAAVGGGAAAAGIAGSIAAGTTAKVVAAVAVSAVLATGAVKGAPAVRHAIAPTQYVAALPSAPVEKPAAPESADGAKRVIAAAAADRPAMPPEGHELAAGAPAAPPVFADDRPAGAPPVAESGAAPPDDAAAGAPHEAADQEHAVAAPPPATSGNRGTTRPAKDDGVKPAATEGRNRPRPATTADAKPTRVQTDDSDAPKTGADAVVVAAPPEQAPPVVGATIALPADPPADPAQDPASAHRHDGTYDRDSNGKKDA